MERIGDEVVEFFVRFGSWIMGIIIGVSVKLAFESKRRKLTMKEKVIKTIISIFAGYIAGVYWDYKGWEESMKLAVPIATIIGESVVEFIMENSKTIMKAFVKKNFDVDKEDLK
jgi:hypothetical protein